MMFMQLVFLQIINFVFFYAGEVFEKVIVRELLKIWFEFGRPKIFGQFDDKILWSPKKFVVKNAVSKEGRSRSYLEPFPQNVLEIFLKSMINNSQICKDS